MKFSSKTPIIIKAAVALILLLSAGVSAVHSTSTSFSTNSGGVATMFYYADQPYMTVTVTPSSLITGQQSLAGNLFATLELADEGVSTVVGEAQLPVISRFLEVPWGADPQVIIESVDWQMTSLKALHLPSSVLPVQPPLVKIEGATVPFTQESSFYSQDMFVPSTIAQISVIGQLRGRTMAFLQISPVQYNPVSGDIRIMKRCDIRIDLPNSDFARTESQIERYTTESFEQLFQTSFVNYGALKEMEHPGVRDEEGYLIIVHDSFYDAIEPFANWKTSLGFETTVTKTSEIAGSPTKEQIKDYLVNAYTSWPIPPSYVLLVGDVAQIPTWTGTETGTCTDLYYATMDQGNYFADFVISRFPAATVDQVNAMVEKTMFYEAGVFPNESWIKKAAFLASTDNHGVSEGTHNFVIETYLEPRNYTCDRLYSYSGATSQQVTNALNDGRSLCIYSGHGSTTSWADGPPYSQSNVNSLVNDGMYPLVCSHACLTNQFTVSECFGETWVRAPNKAGVAFWGATDYSYWDEDDILERRMFKAWWEDNLETIGGMTNMALYYLYEYYGGSGLTKYYFEEYNVLGDSSVKIWNGETNINTPPSTPDTPSGPAEGQIGVGYTFTTSSNDAQNDQVYYMVSWGDEMTNWLGPYPSGQTIAFNHTWTNVGEYSIRIMAKDMEGLQSDWSEAANISINALPVIEIGEITASFGAVTAEIKNVGAGAATEVNWSIAVQGSLVLLGRTTTGSFDKILPGFAPKAKTGFVFGLGGIDIIVTVGEQEKTASGLLLGPFLLNVD
jgi:hypothetical protein